MNDLNAILEQAAKQTASDVHLVAGAKPFFRVNGELSPADKEPMSIKDLERIVSGLLSEKQLTELEDRGDVDTGAEIGGVNVRMNIHKQREGLGIAIRLIPSVIPSPEELGFHETMIGVPSLQDGIVIVSGPAGSGKSTTLAAMVEMMDAQNPRHIITLEDPIEYRFEPKNALVEQRQLGTDFPSFPAGLRHVLRQDPDVIVVGEMRDPETISLAVTAAETGHLVLSTLHAPNASEVIERIVNVFEGPQQQQILVQLAATLRVVVAQRLFPTTEGRVAAREILTSTPAVQNAIRQNNLGTLRSAIQTGKKFGMITMEQSMKQLGLS